MKVPFFCSRHLDHSWKIGGEGILGTAATPGGCCGWMWPVSPAATPGWRSRCAKMRRCRIRAFHVRCARCACAPNSRAPVRRWPFHFRCAKCACAPNSPMAFPDARGCAEKCAGSRKGRRGGGVDGTTVTIEGICGPQLPCFFEEKSIKDEFPKVEFEMS